MADLLRIIAKNKKAYYKFEILDKLEAGITLTGSEVKSLREGKCSLNESYAKFRGSELFLVGAHIPEYQPAGGLNHKPTRPRKLLLHRGQLNRLMSKVNERGYSIVPMCIYFNTNGLIKAEVALAKGRSKYDHREKLKEKDMEKRVRRYRE